MKFFLAVLALFCILSSIASQKIWSLCPGDRSKDVLEIIDVKTNPQVPKAGSSFSISLLGRVYAPITGGNVHTVVYYAPAGYEYPFFEGDSDLCSAFDGALNCPIPPGQLSRNFKADIPIIAPRGGPYNGTLSLTTSAGSTITCLNFGFNMQ